MQTGTEGHTEAGRYPVRFSTGNIILEGDIYVPESAQGLVIFAHGSGSSRHSPRNKYVASVLNEGSIGALLIDLLTLDEDLADISRFDIALLTSRLVGAIEWAEAEGPLRNSPMGLFGASTGAAAALQAAAILGTRVSALVSRGGRPDLAGAALSKVECPTLLIVGGDDSRVIPLNENDFSRLASARKQFVTIPGASHLFEEPGALEHVARLSTKWFQAYL